MREGPSESPYRRRFQTTFRGCSQKPCGNTKYRSNEARKKNQAFFVPGAARSVQNHETACSAATTSRLQVSVRRSHSTVVPPRCVPAGRVGTEPSWRLKRDHFPALLY